MHNSWLYKFTVTYILDIKQREITAILFKRYAGILKFGFKISGLSYIIQKCTDIDTNVDIRFNIASQQNRLWKQGK
jgi:hypothetical protein